MDNATAARERLESAHQHRNAAFVATKRGAPLDNREHEAQLANDALAAAQVHATLAIAAALTGHAHEEADQRGRARRHTPPGAIPIANHRGTTLTADERANYLASLRDDARYTIEGADLRALIMGWEVTVAECHEAEGNVMSARGILEEGNQWAELRDALGFPIYTALRSALGYTDDEPGA